MAANAMSFIFACLFIGISARVSYDPLVPMEAEVELNATAGVGAFPQLAALITRVYANAREIPKLTGDSKTIKDLLKASSITINFNPSDYNADIAKVGTPLKVMNVWDRGTQPKADRINTEEELFGYKSNSANHPYYGAINFWGCALGAVPHETYGVAAFHLVEAVKEYSTFLYADSLTTLEAVKAVHEEDAYINSLSYFIKEANPPKKKKPEDPSSSPWKPTIAYFVKYDGVEEEVAELLFASKFKATAHPDADQIAKISVPREWYFEVQVHGNIELEGGTSKLDHLSGDFQNLFGTAKGKNLIDMAKRVAKPLIWGFDCQLTSSFAGIDDLTTTKIWTSWSTLDTPEKKKAAFTRLAAGKGTLTD